MRRLVPMLLAGLALGAAGCGDDYGGSGRGGGGESRATGPIVRISMKNVLNVPRAAEAKVGQTIVWSNDDPFAHTVTAEKGADFDSGNMAAGARYEFEPTEAGTIDYICRIHPNQTGTIAVSGS